MVDVQPKFWEFAKIRYAFHTRKMLEGNRAPEIYETWVRHNCGLGLGYVILQALPYPLSRLIYTLRYRLDK